MLLNAPKKLSKRIKDECSSSDNSDGYNEEESYALETRGRKEMELPDYRVHVQKSNDENDVEIGLLQDKKNHRSTTRTKAKELSLQIARI